MRRLNLFARLRRPLTVGVSAVAVAAVTLPGGMPSTHARSMVMQRIIATPIPIVTFAPKHVSIPKIGVDAPIVPVLTYTDGTMGSPKTAGDVGWWPGRKAGKGNVLLDGHHDWNGVEGSFYRLGDLKPGDRIVMTGDKPSKTLTYKIVWVKNYDRNVDATDLLGNKNGQVATLITCGGTFDTIAHTHRERVVVRARLVSA